MTNHLGNILVTISDKKQLAVVTPCMVQDFDGSCIGYGPSVVQDYFGADVVTANDYYPFGMPMPGRKYSDGGSYRYGFNGKENDKDISEGGQDYGMRIYDGRLGRFLSVDPYGSGYPYYSSYQFSGNTPIQALDLGGGEPVGYSTSAAFKHPGFEWMRTASDKSIVSNVKGNWYKMMIRDGNGKDWVVYRRERTEEASYGDYKTQVVRSDFYYLDNNCNSPTSGSMWVMNPDGTFAGNLISFDAQERVDAKASATFADAYETALFITAASIAALEAGIGLGAQYNAKRGLDELNEGEENNPYLSQTKKQLEASKKSFEKLIKEHKQKLKDMRKDPEGMTKPEKLKEMTKDNPTKEILRNRLKRQEKEVIDQIEKQKGELKKVNEALKKVKE